MKRDMRIGTMERNSVDTNNMIQFNYTAVINGAIEGSQEAFDLLYEKSLPEISRVVYSRLGESFRDIADEVIQNTYIKIYRNLDKIENPNSFIGWAKSIARNEAISQIRHYKSIGKYEFYTAESDDDDGFTVSDYAVDEDNIDVYPELKCDRDETVRLMREILSVLPEEHQECMLLWGRDYTYREIADATGMPFNTVKSIISRDKKTIKDKVLELRAQGTPLYSLTPLGFFKQLVDASVAMGVLNTIASGSAASAVYWMSKAVNHKTHLTAKHILDLNAQANNPAGLADQIVKQGASNPQPSVTGKSVTAQKATTMKNATAAKSVGTATKTGSAVKAGLTAKKVVSIIAAIAVIGGGATAVKIANPSSSPNPAYGTEYARVLEENRAAIEGAHWDDANGKTVSLVDLDKNGTPELIFFTPEELLGYQNENKMHIYTMKGDEAVELDYDVRDKDGHFGGPTAAAGDLDYIDDELDDGFNGYEPAFYVSNDTSAVAGYNSETGELVLYSTGGFMGEPEFGLATFTFDGENLVKTKSIFWQESWGEPPHSKEIAERDSALSNLTELIALDTYNKESETYDDEFLEYISELNSLTSSATPVAMSIDEAIAELGGK